MGLKIRCRLYLIRLWGMEGHKGQFMFRQYVTSSYPRAEMA